MSTLKNTLCTLVAVTALTLGLMAGHVIRQARTSVDASLSTLGTSSGVHLHDANARLPNAEDQRNEKFLHTVEQMRAMRGDRPLTEREKQELLNPLAPLRAQ